MTRKTRLLSTTLLTMVLSAPAFAQDVPASANDDVLRIGLVYTLSGPPAALGVQARDGFMLGVEEIGALGGMQTEI
ncbi:MAG TPA: ABC transporter substrate-binding protein, partial [Paracoccus sp.]|nr:ABC transporter substrate-binding protein [Paracoccus sp. (in: a-proteobacteria)]